MTDRRFEYDERLLEDCVVGAEENPADASAAPLLSVEAAAAAATTSSSLSACRDLFALHAMHFQRPSLSLVAAAAGQLREDDDGETATTTVDAARFRAFVENARFVFHHNSNQQQQLRRAAATTAADPAPRGTHLHLHRVSLNRFSDSKFTSILQEATEDDGQEDDDNTWVFFGGEQEEEAAKNGGRRLLAEQLSGFGGVAADRGAPWALTTIDDILQAAIEAKEGPAVRYPYGAHGDEGIGKGSMHHLHGHKNTHTTNNNKRKESNDHKITYHLYPTDLELPTATTATRTSGSGSDDDDDEHQEEEHFRTPELERGMDGALLKIRRNHHRDRSLPRRAGRHRSRPDAFARHLNWATDTNPDGVPIVNPPFDQVRTSKQTNQQTHTLSLSLSLACPLDPTKKSDVELLVLRAMPLFFLGRT
jgi:hypothetical protein